jgi:hypothetical protein
MANRICALCKRSGDMKEMIRLGKDFICYDRLDCYEAKLKIGNHNSN